jgi:adenylate cyclase, class 2
MREIEIKAKVSDKAALLTILKNQNVDVSEPITHHDRVFGLPGEPGADVYGPAWLRIRTETRGNQISQIFTLKKSVTNQMDSIEHETEVTDAKELEKIILHLGYTPYSDLTKTRQKAHLGDIEICIDTVGGLGDFIEVEKLTDEDADYDTVAEELWKVLEGFSVAREDHVTDGYDVLMRKHEGIDD